MTRRAPRLEDVAREAGVSRATVSRVVNGIRNVDPAIQDAVRDAIARTGYAPNGAARALVTRRARTLALVVSGAGDDSEDGQNLFASQALADPFFGRVVSGVVGFLRPRSMYPVLMFAETDAARHDVVEYLRQGRADGALIFSTHAEDPLPALLAAERLPCVLFARPGVPAPVTYVDLAHRDGARLAAEHLLARGAAASPPSPDRWTCRPPRTGWPGSARRWSATAIRTYPSPKAGSPPTAGRPRSADCCANTPPSTGFSPPTT